MTGGDVGFDKPNTTQIPDEFWRLLPEMGEAEVKVTLYLLRQTFGFRRDWTPREYATNAAIAKNTGLSEEGVRRGVAAGMKACRIDRQVGPDGRGWIYRVILRTPNDADVQGIAQPVVVVVGAVTPNEVDPQPSGPPTKLTPNEVDPLNIRQELKPSFAEAQDGCAATPSPAPARRRRAIAEGAEQRTPSPQQLMFGECADVIGVDLALVDEVTKSNLGKLAAAFIAAGVPLGMPTEAWASERRRIAGFADGRPISPPSVAKLRTLVGAYRKAKAEGTAEDLGPGRYRDPITGRLVVDWRVAR